MHPPESEAGAGVRSFAVMVIVVALLFLGYWHRGTLECLTPLTNGGEGSACLNDRTSPW